MASSFALWTWTVSVASDAKLIKLSKLFYQFSYARAMQNFTSAFFGSHTILPKEGEILRARGGLYDIHGNVAEFTSSASPGGQFDASQFKRYWKGNAYDGKDPEKFRAGFSPIINPGQSFYTAGFRLAR